MYRPRVIPCLLLKENGLVKTIKFKNPVYVGDPINAVHIFNEKEVDELVVLDITASVEKKEPNFELIAEIAGECFMPFCYGGGISSFQQVKRLIRCGVEKVAINTAAIHSQDLIADTAAAYGSQAVVGAIDVQRDLFGKVHVMEASATIKTKISPLEHAVRLVDAGAGEIFLNSVNRDGTFAGYDIELIRSITAVVTVPVVACGGAGKYADFTEAITAGGASAVAAGSLFVFYGKHRAVLINYPGFNEDRAIR
jgi:cyclase